MGMMDATTSLIRNVPRNQEEREMNKIIKIGLVSLLIVSIFSLFFLGTPEGITYLDKHTKIPCHLAYHESMNVWNFALNSSENSKFIERCKDRGVGA